MRRDLDAIGKALDAISHQWLGDNYPDLLEAIEVEVGHGATPEKIRRYVMFRTDRLELAMRCEQAARYLASKES